MRLENACKVCLTEVSDRVFQPCGHLSCCSTCTKRLRDCPICRLTIEASVVVVYPKLRKKSANNFLDFDLFLKKHKYFGIPESERYALFWQRCVDLLWCQCCYFYYHNFITRQNVELLPRFFISSTCVCSLTRVMFSHYKILHRSIQRKSEQSRKIDSNSTCMSL